MSFIENEAQKKLTQTNDVRIKWGYLRTMIKLIYNLHKIGIIHGDSHIGNFMIDKMGKCSS